jgi:uncharacterized protein DUF4440
VRVIIVSLLALCASRSVALGQEVDPTLRAAAEDRSAARRAGDADTYGRYVMDDAIFVMPSGSVQTKATRLAIIRGNVSAGPQPRIVDETYRVFAGGATRTFRYESVGQPSPQRWTEVWIKQGSDWKLINVQLTNIDRP